MAERSWFFNAEQTGEDEYDRVYLAEDFAKYFSLFISNGVFPNPSTGLQVLAQTVPNMTVTLKPGFAFINGYGYENTSDYVFTIDTADGVLNREDSIFIRWYLTDRKIAAYKAVGTPGAEASHVDLIRTKDYWDLCVARITVKAGVTSITQSAITDTRLNTDLCGIVATLVDQVDTTTLYNQIQADLEEFQNVSEEDFTAWYQQQQQMFTAWYQQQQQMFNTWYQEQQSDFDEWFDDINSKLGTEPATALQQQIDEINTSIKENSDRWFSTYHHVKNGTTHIFSGSGSNGKVKMAADVESGDTVKVSWMPQQEMTIEGKTTQAGTGDPSPENIRPISGVGMYDQCVVFDGSEDEDWQLGTTGTEGKYKLQIIATPKVTKVPATSVAPIKSDRFRTISATGTWDNQTGIAAQTNNIYIYSKEYQTVQSWKSYLSAHPLTVWYQSVDHYKSKGPFYTVVELSNDPYRAVGFELNQPLFDGDSLKVGGLSGFDRMAVLDGSDDETWSKSSSYEGFYFALDGVKDAASPISGGGGSRLDEEYGAAASHTFNYFPLTSWSQMQGGHYFSVNGTQFGCNYPEASTLAEFKSYLQSHPLIVFYRSTEYTEENDIPVALEKHNTYKQILNGDFPFETREDPSASLFILNTRSNNANGVPAPKDALCVCDTYKGVQTSWNSMPDNGIQTTTNYIGFKDTRYSSVEEAKQGLNKSPITVVYELATPVSYAHLTQTESLPAYYGTEDFVMALAGEPVTDKWLTFINDGAQLNFKGGGGLSSSKLAAADAEPGEVLEGVKFYAGDKTLKTGTMPNQGAKTIMYAGSDVAIPEGFHNGSGKVLVDGGNKGTWSSSVSAGSSINIPKGWHNGKGKVTADSLGSQTPASAKNGDIILGKTAWVNGVMVTGTMPEKGTWNGTYSGSDVTIPNGHHSGAGKVSVSGGNRGAWSETIDPGVSVPIPQGYHNGRGMVRANGIGINFHPIDRTVGWGSGVRFTGEDATPGVSGKMHFVLKYWCRTEYNVNGYIKVLRNGSEIHSTTFNKNYDSPYNDDVPNGYINVEFSGSGTYQIQVSVDYNAGNGEIKMGGAFIGY